MSLVAVIAIADRRTKPCVEEREKISFLLFRPPKKVSSAISFYLFIHSFRLLHIVVFSLSLRLSQDIGTLTPTTACLCHDDIDSLRTSVISFSCLVLVVVRSSYGVDTVNSLLSPIVLFLQTDKTINNDRLGKTNEHSTIATISTISR